MFIKLTGIKDRNGLKCLVNTDQVTGFYDGTSRVDDSKITYISWNNVQRVAMEVQETIEEIEAMLNKINEVPDVH